MGAIMAPKKTVDQGRDSKQHPTSMERSDPHWRIRICKGWVVQRPTIKAVSALRLDPMCVLGRRAIHGSLEP